MLAKVDNKDTQSATTGFNQAVPKVAKQYFQITDLLS